MTIEQHRTLSSLRELISRFAQDTRGNVMIIFAAAAVPMAVGVAGAMEFSQYHSMKSALQEASDRAALSAMAAMREGPRAMRRQARQVMKSYGLETKALRGASSDLDGRITRKGRHLTLRHQSTITIDQSMTGLKSFVSDKITVTSYVLDRIGDGQPPRLASEAVARKW